MQSLTFMDRVQNSVTEFGAVISYFKYNILIGSIVFGLIFYLIGGAVMSIRMGEVRTNDEGTGSKG